MRSTFGAAVCAATAALVWSAAAAAQTLKIQLTSVTTIQVPHDTKPKNQPNKGDFIYFRDLLLNRAPQFGKKTKEPVAWDVGLVSYRSPSERVLTCTVTFPGLGSITYGGIVIDGKNGSSFPIISGTGGFKGAKGTVTLGKGTSTSPNTLVVTVPGDAIDIHSGAGIA